MRASDSDQQINYKWPKYLYLKKANSQHVLRKYIRLETLSFHIAANMYLYIYTCLSMYASMCLYVYVSTANVMVKQALKSDLPVHKSI